MSDVVLTGPQALGLYVLYKAKRLKRPLPKGRLTEDNAELPWAMKIESRVATKLVALGLARELSVLTDGREIHGADLARFLGHWRSMFMITPLGSRFWRRLSARQRYGLGERGEALR